MNPDTHKTPALGATSGSDSLTLATIVAAMASVRTIGPIYNWIVVKPGMKERLRANSTPGTVPGTLDGGMVIYEKQQMADSWAFANESLLRKYLAGELSELDLMQKCFDGVGCKPDAKTSPMESDPYQSEEYQKFVEESAKECHCHPDCGRPCDGVLAGGLCDGRGLEPDFTMDDLEWSEENE